MSRIVRRTVSPIDRHVSTFFKCRKKNVVDLPAALLRGLQDDEGALVVVADAREDLKVRYILYALRLSSVDGIDARAGPHKAVGVVILTHHVLVAESDVSAPCLPFRFDFLSKGEASSNHSRLSRWDTAPHVVLEAALDQVESDSLSGNDDTATSELIRDGRGTGESNPLCISTLAPRGRETTAPSSPSGTRRVGS